MTPPKETTTTTSTPKKPCSKTTTISIHEETLGASMLERSSTKFPRYYIPPKKYKTNPINLSKYSKCKLVEMEIPPGVIVEEDMLGLIPSLKYEDHDITDEKKFLELAPRNYLNRYISIKTKLVVIEPKIWETWLQKVGLMNLFDIPHFGRSVEINAYVKMLLSCVHGGYLWINIPESIDT
jgi:hypothetical protein